MASPLRIKLGREGKSLTGTATLQVLRCQVGLIGPGVTYTAALATPIGVVHEGPAGRRFTPIVDPLLLARVATGVTWLALLLWRRGRARGQREGQS